MIQKTKEKEKAIRLRKMGYSYREILEEIPVAKSSLSLWLRNVGLAKEQKQRLTEKKLASALRGSLKRQQERIEKTKKIKEEAIGEVGKLTERELWLISVALYWAEGTKEKEIGGRVKTGRVRISNSDPFLVKVFLKWLLDIYKIPRARIYFRIFLHETSRHRLNEVQKYWSTVTGFPLNCFNLVTWKKNLVKTKRKNIGENYFGLVDIGVRESTNLIRKIAGWVEGIHKNL
ncbi:MAG: hypothetical protein NTV62_01170 [Candidatus Gribaldobacteria bacterium]|nr:hypothetical protein [Candidatus Gribaldobacteria bacterium]